MDFKHTPGGLEISRKGAPRISLKKLLVASAVRISKIADGVEDALRTRGSCGLETRVGKFLGGINQEGSTQSNAQAVQSATIKANRSEEGEDGVNWNTAVKPKISLMGQGLQ